MTTQTLDLEIALASVGLDVGTVAAGAVAALWRDGSAFLAREVTPGMWHVDAYEADAWMTVTLADDPSAAEPSWSSYIPITSAEVLYLAQDGVL